MVMSVNLEAKAEAEVVEAVGVDNPGTLSNPHQRLASSATERPTPTLQPRQVSLTPVLGSTTALTS